VPKHPLHHLDIGAGGNGKRGAILLSNLLMGLLPRTRTGLVGWIAVVVLLTVVIAGLWMAGSLRVFPHPEDATWRGVIPGALLFAFGVELLHVVTVVWFAPYLQSKSQTYGAIGAAFAILLWAYLLGRVTTAAAALNAVMWDKPSRATQPHARTVTKQAWPDRARATDCHRGACSRQATPARIPEIGVPTLGTAAASEPNARTSA